MRKQELTNWLLSLVDFYKKIESDQLDNIQKDLLGYARSYYPIEKDARTAIIKSLSEKELTKEDQESISDLINILKKLGVSYKDFSIDISDSKPINIQIEVLPKDKPIYKYEKPQNWNEVPSIIQKQLLESDQPFENYIYPIFQSKSLYSQIYKAIHKDLSKGCYSIIIPDLIKDNDGDNSKIIWENKIEIIKQLVLIRKSIHHGKLAKIIDYDRNQTCSYIVFENSHRNLETRLKESGQIKAKTAINLGMALCSFLEELQDCGLFILHLSPNNICYEDTDGLKELVLLEPTEIYPLKGVLPEYNEFDIDEIKNLYSPEKTSIQCFLVSSIILYILNHQELENKNLFEKEITYSKFTAIPDFDDYEIERLIEPFSNKLEKRFYEEQNIDFHNLAKILRWGLEPNYQKRYHSLNQLRSDLKCCFI